MQAEKLDLMPSTIHLMLFEEDYRQREGQQSYYVKFYQEIKILREHYQFILLDCPPSVYKTTKCDIFSSDQVIVPCNTDALSWMGLQLLAQRTHHFANQTSAEFEAERPGAPVPLISALILNNIDTAASSVLTKSRAKLDTRLSSLKIKNQVREDTIILPVTIRHATAFQKGSFEFRPLLFSEHPNDKLLSDYKNMATLFLERFGG